MKIQTINVPSASQYIPFKTIDEIALEITRSFRAQKGDRTGFCLDVDCLLDWLDISLYCDDFVEPEGVACFASFSTEGGGTIRINRKYEDLFGARPDVYRNCIGHEVGHAVLRHLEHASMNIESPLFPEEKPSPPLLHKSSWHQYGLTSGEVRKRQEDLKLKQSEWVKHALTNSMAREALKNISEKFEPLWMFRQAEHFAKCLAVPLDSLIGIVQEIPLSPGWQSIYRLAERFGVSATTMKIRLEKLQMIKMGPDNKPVPIPPASQPSLFQ